MSFLDTLGDIGYGFTNATNAAGNMYQNWDKAVQSGITTDRQRDQYQADKDYDIFNAQASANRSQLDWVGNQNELGAKTIEDQLDQFNPETRAAIGQLLEEHGSADSPEFRRAFADYLAGKGMLKIADPEYQRARREEAAGQQVAAMLRATPGYEDVHSVTEMVEDDGSRKIYALVGEPDEDGNYEVKELPAAAMRQYQALMGNTQPLSYDQKMQAADTTARTPAAQLGTGVGKPTTIKPPSGNAPATGFTLSQKDVGATYRANLRTVENDVTLKGLSADEKVARAIDMTMKGTKRDAPQDTASLGGDARFTQSTQDPQSVPNLSGGAPQQPQQQQPQQRPAQQRPAQQRPTPAQLAQQLQQPRQQTQPQYQAPQPRVQSNPVQPTYPSQGLGVFSGQSVNPNYSNEGRGQESFWSQLASMGRTPNSGSDDAAYFRTMYVRAMGLPDSYADPSVLDTNPEFQQQYMRWVQSGKPRQSTMTPSYGG